MRISTEESNSMVLPQLDQWSLMESYRLLLEPRKQIISTIFRALAAGALLFGTPIFLILAWVILIFSANFWMKSLIAAYSTISNTPSTPHIVTPSMHAIVDQYKTAWLINCVIWGALSFLSQIWLPDAPRVACIAILNALMFLSITRTCVDHKLMHQVSAILIVSQFLAAIMRLVINNENPTAITLFLGYSSYLFLTWYLLWVVGNQFNKMHLQRLDFEYSKLHLIESLKHSQQQLHTEQHALIAANSVVQKFYSGAAHDLRQPVYAMQLYTSMLEDDLTKATALLPKISQSCSAINAMFNTLFDYQQLHMNDAHLVDEKINIKEVFESLALSFQPLATAKDLRIRFKPVEGFVTMKPLYLMRILSNLITNAIRYSIKGGVLLGVRKTSTHISFEVWDTGIGIDEALKHTIFNEFYKINKIDSSEESLGLGLSIVKQLTACIPGAEIAVQSRLGYGSVFKFKLPLALYSKH